MILDNIILAYQILLNISLSYNSTLIFLLKILKLQEDLESEIESLRSDRRALEFHIDRTETWTENIGKWRANINNADVRSYLFIITN